MNKNEIFILCLGISVAIIFLLITVFAKGDITFILSVFVICVALLVIAICLYLMNNMLNKLDTNTKSTGEDIGLLKKAITYIAEDNNNASEYIVQFLEAVADPTKEISNEGLTVYVPDELKELESNAKQNDSVNSNDQEEIKDTMIEVDMNHLTPVSKNTLTLVSTTVSSKVLTDALKRLVENMNSQTQTVQQIQNTTVETVVNAIQSNPEVQQAIFTTPAVQDTISQNTQIIQQIIQSQPIQNIIENGGNVDLTDIRTSISNLNTVTEVQGANIIEMDKFLKFVDQTSHYVDEEGVHATIYNGVDISKLQAILTGGSTINLQAMQTSINSLNNIVTSQDIDLTTIDNYLKFVDQTLHYVDEEGNSAVIYPGINNS
jgi:Ca2+/Na+ antiporter